MIKKEDLKVGDKVRVVKSIHNIPVGYELTVGNIYGLNDVNWLFSSVQENNINGGIDTSWAYYTRQADCFELVRDISKFKVGDKVKYCNNLTGIIGCIENGNAYMSLCEDDSGKKYTKGDGGCSIDGKYFMGYNLSELVLVEDYKNNDTCCVSENKTVKNIMSSIKEFVKNSLLSEDEKLLRKYGLKDSCGEYTSTAYDLIEEKLTRDNEAYLIECAKGLEKEENKKNK